MSASASTAWSTFWGARCCRACRPAELLRRLVAAVLEHSAYGLHDDTTLLRVQRRDGKA